MLMGVPTILGVLVVVLVGYGLSRSPLTSAEFWQGASRVGYWVLFPILLFRTIVQIEAPAETFWQFFWILTISLLLITLIMSAISWLAGLKPSAMGCVLQGSFRHNGFLALAVIQGMFGNDGLVLAAIAISVLVPPSNVMAVVVMALVRPKQGEIREKKWDLSRYIAKEISRNPLIISIILALLMRLFSLQIPPVLDEASALLSQAALTFMLLTVGAGLKFTALDRQMRALLLASGAKLIIFPALLVSGGMLMGLPTQQLIVLAVFGAVPTASSSYVLVQEMRGDAPLMAAIIMMQTLLSIPALIGWIWLVS